MVLDVSALHTGLDGVHVCRPPRGKNYVDFYVKAFYLSEDETIHWVLQNWQNYAYRHLCGMLTQTIGSSMVPGMKNKKLKDAIAELDQLYENEAPDIA